MKAITYVFLTTLVASVIGCSGRTTPTGDNVSTDYGVGLGAVNSYDSVVSVASSQGETDVKVSFLPSAQNADSSISWQINAPEKASVQVVTQIWKDGVVVATQEETFVSGESPKRQDALLVPRIAVSKSLVCYLDLDRCMLLGSARSQGGVAQTKIQEASFDINADGKADTTVSGGTFGADSISIKFSSVPGLVAGENRLAIFKVTEMSGRVFRDTAHIQILASAAALTDSRDGKVYGFRQIGTQVWMTQNLDYAPLTATGADSSSWCYDNLAANCAKYGRLYTWATAMEGSTKLGAQGVCPNGWHVPTYGDYDVLSKFVDNADDLQNDWTSGTSLKSDSTWLEFPGTDLFGFRALAGGYYAESGFYSLDKMALFWSSSMSYQPWASYRALTSWSGFSEGWHSKSDGYSVRCIQDTILQ